MCSSDGSRFLFFFFKQKTAYEMRISDWSSDVCSSDLWVFIVTAIPALLLVPVVLSRLPRGPAEARWLSDDQKAWIAHTLAADGGPPDHGTALRPPRDFRALLLCVAILRFPFQVFSLRYCLPMILRGFGVSHPVHAL